MDYKEETLSTIYTKIGIIAGFILIVLFGYIFAPKQLFNPTQIYNFSGSIAKVEENNIVLHSYKVYGSEQRFEKGLTEDIQEVLNSFIANEDILLVKIHGEDSLPTYKDNYWFMTDSETPELNIEYYVVINVDFMNTSLPCHTFIGLAKDISNMINAFYLTLLIIISWGIITPLSLSLANKIPVAIKIHKEK